MDWKKRLVEAQSELLREIDDLRRHPDRLEGRGDVTSHLEALEAFAKSLLHAKLQRLGPHPGDPLSGEPSGALLDPTTDRLMTRSERRVRHESLSKELEGTGGPNDWSDVI